MVDVANNRRPDQDDGYAHEQSCDYQTFHLAPPHSTESDKLATLIVRREYSHVPPGRTDPLEMAAEPIVCGQDPHM